MKKVVVLLVLLVCSIALYPQIYGKKKGFDKVYKVNADVGIDSIETMLLESFMEPTIANFLIDLSVDTLVLEKKFQIDPGIYLFLSKYDDSKVLSAPYESSFVDYRFSQIDKWMVFLTEIKSKKPDDQFDLKYGKEKFKLY